MYFSSSKGAKSDFQSHFATSRIIRIFLIFVSIQNNSLGKHFLLKICFDNFHFWKLFSKIMLNFCHYDIHCIPKIQWFLLSMLIFGQQLIRAGLLLETVKKSSWPVTGFQNRGPLKDLNDSKLIQVIPLIIQDQFYIVQNLQRSPTYSTNQ